VNCKEPKGDVERSIYPFVFSEENVRKFWNQAKKYPQIFGKDTIGDIEDFLNMFFYLDGEGLWQTNNLFYVVDDFVGMLSLTNIYHPTDALMHFTFYDGRLRGRENLVKEIIKYVMSTYEFNRLSAEIPAYVSKSTLKFLSDHVGLVLEGKKRLAQYGPQGNLVDVLLYGVTKQDIEEWEHQRHKQLVVEVQPL
jgi:hypothetical protein